MVRGSSSVVAVLFIIATLSTPAPAPDSLRDDTDQGQGTWVRYEVEFSTTGPLLDPNCTAAGTDVLAGTIMGLQTSASRQPTHYIGMLSRTTRISLCGERTLADGSEVVCSMTFTGNGVADIELSLDPGRGAWLQYLDDRSEVDSILPPRPTGRSSSTVAGTCDPAEMAQLQGEYDGGESAGSPTGQPIEVDRFPPPAYPHTYQAKPPVSIWTLKVLRRLP